MEFLLHLKGIVILHSGLIRSDIIISKTGKLVIIIITLPNTTLFNHLLNLASISGLTTHDE